MAKRPLSKEIKKVQDRFRTQIKNLQARVKNLKDKLADTQDKKRKAAINNTLKNLRLSIRKSRADRDSRILSLRKQAQTSSVEDKKNMEEIKAALIRNVRNSV